MTTRKLLKPTQLFADGSFHAGWGLLVADGVVESAGPLGAVESVASDVEVVELPDRAIVPGTVSTHTHSFQYLMRGFGDDLPFLEWRSAGLYKYSLGLDAEGLYTGALLSFGELARHGVTTIVDFFYINSQANDNASAVIRAARDLGLRIVLARAFYDWDGAPASYQEDVATAVKNFEALSREWAQDPLVSIQPAPHSIHGASTEMIRAAATLAIEHELPMHMHIAEEQYQVRECLEAHGKTPLRYVEDCGVLDTKLICVHGCWLDDEEITMLGEINASLAYNPSSNMFLADGVTPIRKMVDAGVNVTLGVDGGCSNNQASIFGEMRMCSLLQKVDTLDATTITAEQAFDFGTRNAGPALGLPIGQLAPGYAADFVMVDTTDLSLAPVQQLHKNLVYAQSPRAIREVWVAGKPVWKQDLLGISEAEISARVAELTQSWQ